MNTKFRVLELQFKDGNLAERMTSEGLPLMLTPYTRGTSERPEYECSPELLRAMAASGLQYEVLENDPFEGMSKAEVPGSRRTFNYKRARTHNTLRKRK